MSQFDNGPATRIIRAQGAAAPRQQIGTLTAPGLSVTPPVSAAAVELDQLLDTLRIGAAAAEGATEVANSAAYDQRLARSEADANEREAKAEEKQRIAEAKAEARANAAAEREAAQYDRGLGTLHASTDIGTLLDPISRGEQFAGAGDAEALADEFIAGKVKGQTQDYADAYTRHLKPQVVAAITRRRGVVQEQAREANNTLLQRAALEATDSATLMQLEATYLRNNKGADATPLKAKSFLTVAAMNNAAEAGDEKRMQAAAGLLDGQFEPEKRAAQAELLRAGKRKQEGATIEFANAVSSRTNDVLTGKAGSFAEIEDYIKKQRGGLVPETAINTALEANRSAAKSAEREAIASVKLAAKQQAQTNHVMQAAAMGDADMLWNAQPLLSETGEQVMSSHETQQAALEVRLDDIGKKYPPETALKFQVEYAARNGVPFDRWKDLLEAGRRGSSVVSIVGDRPNGQPAEIPPATVAGLKLYQTMRATGPGLIPDMPAKAVEFYEIATTLQQTGEYAGDPQRAILRAAEIAAKPSLGDVSLRAITEQVRNSNTGWFTSAPMNMGEVATDVFELAKVKVRGGMDPKKAVDDSAKQIGSQRVRIGTAMVSVADARMPEAMKTDIQKIAATLAVNFTEKYGKLNLGVDTDDITLMRDRNNGMWSLRRASDGAPLNYPGVDPNDVFFDMGELEVARTMELNQKAKEVVNRWQAGGRLGLGKYSTSLSTFGVGIQ